MDQKKFLTILPIIFIIIVVIIVLIIHFLNENEDSSVLGVSCNETFADEGLGINFDYPCDWEVNLETTLWDSFVYNEENRYGYVAEKYHIRLKEDDQEILIRVILADTKGSIISVENKYEYEIIEDKLLRFSKEENKYKYGEKVNCSDIKSNQNAGNITGNTCTRTMVFGISDNFPAIVEVFNPNNLELTDNFVSSILD